MIRKRIFSVALSLAMVLTLLPVTALAANDDGMPTASGSAFYANGTHIYITKDAPEGGDVASFPGFTPGSSAYISWDDGGTTKYVGVTEDTSVYGGGDWHEHRCSGSEGRVLQHCIFLP